MFAKRTAAHRAPEKRTKLDRVLFDLAVEGKWLGEQLDPPVKKDMVSKWRTGRATIPHFRVPQIARVLGVEPAAFLEDDQLVAYEEAKAS